METPLDIPLRQERRLGDPKKSNTMMKSYMLSEEESVFTDKTLIIIWLITSHLGGCLQDAHWSTGLKSQGPDGERA